MRVLLAGLVGLMVAGCAVAPSVGTTGPAGGGARSAALAVDLYRQVAKEPGNVVVSPTSLAAAMAVVALGAEGETRAGIDRAMHFAPGDPTAALGPELAALGGTRDGARVDIANALWVQNDFALKLAFVAAAKRNLGADVASLDFGQRVAAAGKINRWASDSTAGRIPTIVSSDSFSASTRLVVTNAVYLLADWDRQFSANDTADARFTGRGGKLATVRMMSQRGSYRMIERDGVKAIDVPYRGGRLSMVAILPDDAAGLPDIERRFDARWLKSPNGALDAAAPEAIKLAFPKVRNEVKYELGDALTEMGMGRAFSSAAEFGGIANAPLAISRVVQKTFLKIDEKGTEAAAVTAIGIIVTGMRISRERTFIADHPFLFLIRDRPTGQILFIGRIETPVAG